MTPRTEVLVAAVAELSEEERTELFQTFIVDVESAHTIVELSRLAEQIELERYKQASPAPPLPEERGDIHRLDIWPWPG